MDGSPLSNLQTYKKLQEASKDLLETFVDLTSERLNLLEIDPFLVFYGIFFFRH